MAVLAVCCRFGERDAIEESGGDEFDFGGVGAPAGVVTSLAAEVPGHAGMSQQSPAEAATPVVG
eukprot:10298216-Lingulodinium_polyedra.AAC.1